jgi:hypothetical protein
VHSDQNRELGEQKFRAGSSRVWAIRQHPKLGYGSSEITSSSSITACNFDDEPEDTKIADKRRMTGNISLCCESSLGR